jgi:hypothetical protein
MKQSTFQDEKSHYDPNSPPLSVHGARGEEGAPSVAESVNDNASGDHVEDKAPLLTKRQKVKRHCGRFWLYYLIGSIILLAILLPIL